MNNIFSRGKAEDFSGCQAPSNDTEKANWQESNRNWWELNPMRYDHLDISIDKSEFSPDFYDEVDRRFLGSVKVAFPWRKIPFDQFIDFNQIQTQDVLEIGVGCGTHAQLLAERAQTYTGIDLTEYAVEATTKRLELKGINGRVMQMDAEKTSFENESFDFVWSWGVIHHSSDTKAVLHEIHRVLKSSGELTFMVYHKSLWNTFVRGWLYYGLIKGGLFEGHDANKLLQLNTDGALARYYTTAELQIELGDMYELTHVDYLGNRMQLLPLPTGSIKEFLANFIPASIGRWITNRPFFAYMMVATCKKRDGYIR